MSARARGRYAVLGVAACTMLGVGVACAVLGVAACGSKSEPTGAPPAPAPAASSDAGSGSATTSNANDAVAPNADAAPSSPRAATPEAALTAYVDAKRQRDAEMLWSLMPSEGRSVVDRALERARTQSPAELAQAGLKADDLVGLDGHRFFALLVKVMPAKDAALLTEAPREVAAQMDGESHAWLTYKVAGHDCRGEAKKEADGWKIRGARCGEPEPSVVKPPAPAAPPGTAPPVPQPPG